MSIKKLLVLIIFTFTSSLSSAEDWVEITAAKEFRVYIHLPSVREIDVEGHTYVEALFKDVALNDLPKYGLTVSDYLMIRQQFDCTNKQRRTLSATTYKANGQVTNYLDYSDKPEFIYVRPDSIGEDKFDMVCALNDIRQGRISE